MAISCKASGLCMPGIGEFILKDLGSCEVAKGVLQPFLQVKIMWED